MKEYYRIIENECQSSKFKYHVQSQYRGFLYKSQWYMQSFASTVEEAHETIQRLKQQRERKSPVVVYEE